MRSILLVLALASVVLVPTAAAGGDASEPCDVYAISTEPPFVTVEPKCIPDSPEDVIRFVEELLP